MTTSNHEAPRALNNLTVLKFGGSVLQGEEALGSAVSEIYRHLRQGERVLAVVSAFAGTTDRLLAKARYLSAVPAPAAVAALLATGELTSAALLALYLERAGVPVQLLDVRQIGLTAEGDYTDASPSGLDVEALARAFANCRVAIVPGFIGVAADGRTSLLGRGGSDLTALFIAQKANARRCRLIKDVDGLFEHDPDAEGPPPRCFRQLSWDDCLRLDPRVLQPKGVRFAREHRLAFEVAAPGSSRGTEVGPYRAALHPPLGVSAQRPRRICLLGLGTVGLGVYRQLERDSRFQVVAIGVTDLVKHMNDSVPLELLHDDARRAAAVPHDVLVELIGGRQPALLLIEQALRAGKDVVTANKEVIAHHGQRLAALAARHGAQLCYSAAVAGALPAIETVKRLVADANDPLIEITGVLNGTTNFILDRLAAGIPYAAAVAEAQARGFAEADPTLDTGGFDAACKLAILAREGFNIVLDPAAIEREGIEELTAEQVTHERAAGRVVRHVARCRRTDEGLVCRVAPVVLEGTHPLAQIFGEDNRILITTSRNRLVELTGKGAGRWPTATAVYADLIDIAAPPRPGMVDADTDVALVAI
jgi:homoserine dehydrogenase